MLLVEISTNEKKELNLRNKEKNKFKSAVFGLDESFYAKSHIFKF